MLISLEIIIPIILSIALFTLGERKILSEIQRRKGPNIIGYYGLLQPIIDGLKLLVKECIYPQKSESFYYILAPLYTLILNIIIWAIIPFNNNIIIYDIYFSILFILAITSLTIYGILYGGWASNSKYSFIGSLRATSQLISYELSIGIIYISIISLNNTFNLIDIIYSQIIIKNIFILLPIAILLLITILAETNRTPFDLLEAESELVAGFLVEYSGIIFAAFYLSEYCIILFFTSLYSILFFGSFGISLFSLLLLYIIILLRATLPRLRYDKLIYINWTKILPLSISLFILIFSILFIFDIS
jgi:NADH-ubiquinone oxidoreductase chain 1